MRNAACPRRFGAMLLAAAALWWLAGSFLLLLTPWSLHTPRLGWTAVYWLLLAPLCVMAGLSLRARPA